MNTSDLPKPVQTTGGVRYEGEVKIINGQPHDANGNKLFEINSNKK